MTRQPSYRAFHLVPSDRVTTRNDSTPTSRLQHSLRQRRLTTRVLVGLTRDLDPAQFQDLQVPLHAGVTLPIKRLGTTYQRLFTLLQSELVAAIAVSREGDTMAEILANTVEDLRDDQRLYFVAETVTPDSSQAVLLRAQLDGGHASRSGDPYETMFPIVNAATCRLARAIEIHLLALAAAA